MSQHWAGHKYSGTKWYGRTVGPTFPGTQWTVLGWTNSWSTLGYICHKDQKFLRVSVHGLKRAGWCVTRTKGWGTKRHGTEYFRIDLFILWLLALKRISIPEQTLSGPELFWVFHNIPKRPWNWSEYSRTCLIGLELIWLVQNSPEWPWTDLSIPEEIWMTRIFFWTSIVGRFVFPRTVLSSPEQTWLAPNWS